LNEWLKLMLEEIRRKQREREEILRERARRESARRDGAKSVAPVTRPADPAGPR